ncbi:MAG TPA: FAD-dependent oxidoreductase [Aquabacterium sp.]|uniref:NAD(P)/FAD-dependent oxidoreductase n=1 Tax=Aquabacterium sp. TaxID=1872578 RepID=UPI002E2F882B|nr:FAD-dependent oxidoreductase [Aquabacterium sp.]HEX5373231.1 FAD-dependent oxidoreductase [Aquabacterium sp.]
MKKIAVVGSGVSGLGAAWALVGGAADVQVTLFESDARLGGHAHTVDVSLPDAQGTVVTHGVDTGFLVFNERTYPRLLALFAELGIVPATSDMSFSVQVPRAPGAVRGAQAWMSGLQWCGSSLNSVFSQRRNLCSPSFWSMLRDLLRFNRLATDLARRGDDAALAQPIGAFLDAQGFGHPFRDAYLLPMIACIWSCPTRQMVDFPVGTLIRFCHNHGLLQVTDRPQWYTVRGGSREYVRRLAVRFEGRGGRIRLGTPVRAIERLGDSVSAGEAGVRLITDAGAEPFDEVVLACHSDQALALLGAQASAAERELLGAVRYHHNRAVLHTDTALLPDRRLTWAAWNYERSAPGRDEPAAVCLHYLLNVLQPLPWSQPVVVSLNPLREPRAETVLREFDYAHPVFDQAAVAAQSRLPEIQGRQRVWFCGAWTGYGFHEDGLRSGQDVAAAVLAALDPAAQAPRRAPAVWPEPAVA